MSKFSNTPADKFPKLGNESKEELSAGAKTIRSEMLRLGQAADIGPAPPARVYSDNYSKKPADQADELSPFLGNPLGL